MKTKLKPLDVVRTKFGTLAVVEKLDSAGTSVALTLSENSVQKYAWYTDEELKFVAPLKEIVAAWKRSQ
jgi:hypothetical protein